MEYESKLLIIASKESLNNSGLALGKCDCLRSCQGLSFFNIDAVTNYARGFALNNGYDIVALGDKRETFSGLKFDIDVEFYNLPEEVRDYGI
jgi:hypothetical protein